MESKKCINCHCTYLRGIKSIYLPDKYFNSIRKMCLKCAQRFLITGDWVSLDLCTKEEMKIMLLDTVGIRPTREILDKTCICPVCGLPIVYATRGAMIEADRSLWKEHKKEGHKKGV